MTKLFSALMLLFLASAAPLFAIQRLVPQQYATIQAAINASAHSDTVLVSPGRYYENIKFNGKNITVASLFLTTLDTSYIRSTIIDGSQPQNPDTASVVRIINGEDSTTVLAGFTLTGGKGTKWPDVHNGGVYREGGAILCQNSSPIIRNNFIYQNEAILTGTGINSSGGGAIRAEEGNVQILNNIIMRNKGLYGAGIVLNYCGGLVRNNIISLNSGGQAIGGSGIWMHGTLPTTPPKFIENNTIVGNTSGQAGAGIVVMATTATLRNNILWGNMTSNSPSQIAVTLNGTVTAEYNLIQGGYSGTGNISDFPAFADSAALLLPGSPAIDAGDPAANFNDIADNGAPTQALFPAMGSLRNDMGAYGGQGGDVFISFSQPWLYALQQTVIPGAVQGEQKNLKFAVSNLGLGMLQIDSIRIHRQPAQFQLQNTFPLAMSPVQNDTLRLLWTPVNSGSFRDTIYIYHNDAFQANPKILRILSNVVAGTEEAAGTSFALAAAPNPFSNSTAIRYQLPQSAEVSVSVVDVLGKEVLNLPSQTKAAGEQAVTIDGSFLPQGLYFCRLQVVAGSGEVKTLVCRLVVRR